MKFNYEETARLIALLFKKSGKTRIRISDRTFRFLSRRKRIRSAFVVEVCGGLDDFGITMIELERGGFGLFQTSVLEGAPSVTAKILFTEDFKMKIRKGKVDFKKDFSEIDADDVDDFDDE